MLKHFHVTEKVLKAFYGVYNELGHGSWNLFINRFLSSPVVTLDWRFRSKSQYQSSFADTTWEIFGLTCL